ncbi:MAG TPA: class I SAM-dependent methyltransferase [Polyangiales bacterium]
MPLPPDVPSPTDLRSQQDAREWEQTAMKKRPWRIELFELITRRLAAHAQGQARVLELGAGPGFLAYYVLSTVQTLPHYVLLDYSPAMRSLALERLGPLASRASFLERDFKQPGWTEGLGPFDAVVTVQAVHELRHKRHATQLHAQVRSILAPHGLYLMCDHHTGPGGMQNQELYMSLREQEESLFTAGFGQVELLAERSGLALHLAR